MCLTNLQNVQRRINCRSSGLSWGLFLDQRRAFRIEELHALGELREIVVPVVFVFDAEGAFEVLALEFCHHSFCVAHARSPGGVMGGALLFVQVFEVETNNVALELFEAVDRVKARTDPMAGVGARAEEWAAALDGVEDGLRIPVMGRLWVVVDGDLDVEFFAEFFDGIQVVGLRFADDDVDAHFAGEFKAFAAFRLIRWQGQVDVGECQSFFCCVGSNFLNLGVGQFEDGDLGGAFKWNAGGEAEIFDAERCRLIHFLKEIVAFQRAGVHVELPAELVGGRSIGFGGADCGNGEKQCECTKCDVEEMVTTGLIHFH